jgi:putative tryptophan/tyrosine transport system substrate-binding protein
MSRPGANITGVSFFNPRLSGKALGFLHELVPNSALIALLLNPGNQESEDVLTGAQDAARILGRQLLVFKASIAREIDTAFAAMRNRGVRTLLAGGDPFFTSRRQQIVTLAARDGVVTVYLNRYG